MRETGKGEETELRELRVPRVTVTEVTDALGAAHRLLSLLMLLLQRLLWRSLLAGWHLFGRSLLALLRAATFPPGPALATRDGVDHHLGGGIVGDGSWRGPYLAFEDGVEV